MKCPYCGGNIEIRERDGVVEQLEYTCPYCDGIVKVENNEPKTKYGMVRKIGKDYWEYKAEQKEAERKSREEGKETKAESILGMVIAIIALIIGGIIVLNMSKW